VVGRVLALVFVFLMRSFSIVKAMAIFLLLLAAFSAAGYFFGNKYSEAAPGQPTSEGQDSVIYRRNLIRNYAPLVMERKAFGGYHNLSVMGGQKSIDNEF